MLGCGCAPQRKRKANFDAVIGRSSEMGNGDWENGKWEMGGDEHALLLRLRVFVSVYIYMVKLGTVPSWICICGCLHSFDTRCFGGAGLSRRGGGERVTICERAGRPGKRRGDSWS